MFPLYILLLLGIFLFGLLLLGLGVFLLLKVKNKIAGILVILAGLASSLLPLAVLMFLITVPMRG
jgi:hypothetical protein